MRAAILMMLTAGCTGSGPQFLGTDMTGFFEFENNVGYQWEYFNEDTTLTYKLLGEIENFLIVDGVTEYTMNFRKDCIGVNDPDCADGELVRSIVMTSNFAGVRIFEVDGTRYDPPVLISNQYMKIGDVALSTTAGTDYTSTLTTILADCPVRLPNWTDCAEFEVAGATTDASIDGTYWAIQSFGLVAMDWPGQPGRWELSNHVLLD